MVNIVGLVVPWVQGFGQTEEGFGLVPEIFNVKYGRWLRDFVLL